MTKLSAPAPSPSVQRKNTGRFIDFVGKPKNQLQRPNQSQKLNQPKKPDQPEKVHSTTVQQVHPTTTKPTLRPVKKPITPKKIPTPALAPKTSTAAKTSFTTKTSTTTEPSASAEAPIPVKAVPRRRRISPHGLRMDFVRRPANHPLPEAKAKKTVQISITTDSMPQLTPASKPKPKASSYADPLSSQSRRPVQVVRRIQLSSEPEDSLALESSVESEDFDESEQFDEPIRELEPVEIEPEPLMEDEELSLALAGFADDEADTPSLTDRHSKEVSDLEEELDALDELDSVSDDLEAEIADFVDEPKPIVDKLKSPKPNRFGLGGRSPFLSSVKVEKRPLSGFVPDEPTPPKKEIKTPLKNAYRAKIKQVFKDDSKAVRRETTIISTPEPRSHTIGLAIAILLTVVLGALIGSVIYLVFFQ